VKGKPVEAGEEGLVALKIGIQREEALKRIGYAL